jgi:hypothetical protein
MLSGLDNQRVNVSAGECCTWGSFSGVSVNVLRSKAVNSSAFFALEASTTSNDCLGKMMAKV